MNSYRRLFYAALSIFMTLSASSGQAQDMLRSKSMSADQLRSAVAGGGQTRVIVRLSGGQDAPLQTTTVDSQANRSLQDVFVGSFVQGSAARSARSSVRSIPGLPLVALNIDAADLQALANDSRIETIWPDNLNAPSLAQSVPLIGMTAPAANLASGSGTTVAILDTGIDRNHPFLSGRTITEACYSTNNANASITSLCGNGTSQQTGLGSAPDCTGAWGCRHGTHVAGIAAGNGNGLPSRGVAPQASIYAIQVFSKAPATHSKCTPVGTACVVAYDSDVISALGLIRTTVSGGAFGSTIAAVNLSLGGGNNTAVCDSSPYKPVIDQLKALNVATVIASGNDGYTSATASPACVSTAVTVGGTTKTDGLYSDSNSASWVDLLAPGVSIDSAMSGSTGFEVLTGTSMAAPHVAGAFAAIRSVVPTATVDQITNALASTGTQVTDTRIVGGLSKPRIRVDLALANLGYVAPAPAVMSSPTPGSTFANNYQTFSWTTGTGVDTYYIYVGSSTGNSDYYASPALTSTASLVTNLPCNGSTVYVRLWSRMSGIWQSRDYSYTAKSCPSARAVITAPGNVPLTNSANFAWSTGTGVSSYFLDIGNGGTATNNIYSGYVTGQATTVSGIWGARISVRLWSLMTATGLWLYDDRVYDGPGAKAPAQLYSPMPGTTLSSTTTFNWTAGAGVTSYYLYVGSQGYGSGNIHYQAHTGNSATVSGIAGTTIFVRLWSLIDGAWQFTDEIFSGPGNVKAVITSPAAGATLNSFPNFVWSAGQNVTSYYLYVGTQGSGSNNIYSSAQTGTSAIVGLSSVASGSTVYVRIWSLMGGLWQFSDHVFIK